MDHQNRSLTGFSSRHLTRPVRETDRLPRLIRQSNEQIQRRFVEFFAANIRNKNTRSAYLRAITLFCEWCEDRQVVIDSVKPTQIAFYIENELVEYAKPTVKQHLAAIRMLFDFFVTGGILPLNPAASVKGPKHVVFKGKTPALQPSDARRLLGSIKLNNIAGYRDRAMIALMLYTFARIGAVVALNVEDVYQNGRRWWVRLTPLFRTLDRKRNLSESRMYRQDAWAMEKRRAKAAGLGNQFCNHTMRATGITAYMMAGGTLEKAQQMAAHASSRTTNMYNRSNDGVTLDEVERIIL